MLVSAGVELLFSTEATTGYILDSNLVLCVYKINSIQGKICTHLNGISWKNLFLTFKE